MKPFVIGINGPPQIGKGWLAGHIAQILPYHCRVMSLIEPLRYEAMRIMRWPGKYEDFKKHIYPDGDTGRDKMIQIGTERRKKNINYFTELVISDPRFTDPHTPIIILDDLGFFHEQEYLMNSVESMMTIVMAPTRYSIGCIWEGDSRVCLPPKNGFRTIDSNSALAVFKERLENAASFQSIDSAKRRLWFSALMGRSLVE